MIATPVVGLLFWRSPAAIAWLVIAVVVDAVDRHTRRTAAYIGKEMLEIMPALAYLDAATAVAVIIVDSRIVATLQHVDPAHIFNRASFAVTCNAIELEASAGLRVARTQTIATDQRFISAVAPAQPKCLTVFRSYAARSENDEPSESFSGKIGKGHRDLLTGCGFKWRPGAGALGRCALKKVA